jgi:hypothetical protein
VPITFIDSVNAKQHTVPMKFFISRDLSIPIIFGLRGMKGIIKYIDVEDDTVHFNPRLLGDGETSAHIGAPLAAPSSSSTVDHSMGVDSAPQPIPSSTPSVEPPAAADVPFPQTFSQVRLVRSGVIPPQAVRYVTVATMHTLPSPTVDSSYLLEPIPLYNKYGHPLSLTFDPLYVECDSNGTLLDEQRVTHHTVCLINTSTRPITLRRDRIIGMIRRIAADPVASSSHMTDDESPEPYRIVAALVILEFEHLRHQPGSFAD